MSSFSERSKWIGIDEGWYKVGIDSPAMQLRKVFNYNGQGKAECLICGLGAYVLYINGKRVNDDILSPAFTAYHIRTLYTRYDITDHLKQGENVIAVKLGNGFYNQTTEDEWSFFTATWRNTPRLRLEIFENGSTLLVSDRTWRVTYNGATLHNALREGEYYDGRKEDAWKDADYDDSAWLIPRIVRSPGGVLCEQNMPPIRECETLKPIAVWRSKNGWTYDFGQNIAGYVGIQMRGEAGQTMVLRYAEKLNGKEIDQSNIDVYVKTDRFQQDRYTFKGDGVECWRPEFVYHGFQYLEVSGTSSQPPTDALTAYFVHTDLTKKGSFNSSDELLNWIYDAGMYSFLGNYHGIPTDCPHREKNGWTGDAALSAEYASFYFDMNKAYKKYLIDICDTQRANGQICSIAPSSDKMYNWGTGPAWDCALLFIPYILYKETGDSSCISLVYPHVRKYLEYVTELEDELTLCFGLGDWCAPAECDRSELMSNRFSDTCYYYAMLRVASKMAYLADDPDNANKYLAKAYAVKEKIHELFIDGDRVDNDSQGALATALYFHLVDGSEACEIAKKLVTKLENDEYKYKVGILGINALLCALSEYGYTNIAYKTVARDDYPSYGFWRKMGATTLWERWDGVNSGNHHMYGSVINWITRYVAGIRNTDVAYRSCILEPFFFAEECVAESSVLTPYGKLCFSWEMRDNVFSADLAIPEGINATLILNGRSIPLLPGSYKLTLEVNQGFKKA